jgi:hypothetical protein
MGTVEYRLREQDVRHDAPALAADQFLKLYLESNFPQTSAHPSKTQKEQPALMQAKKDTVDSIKKPQQGTSFDRPDRY